MPSLLRKSKVFQQQQDRKTCTQNKDGYHRVCDHHLHFYHNLPDTLTSYLLVPNGPTKGPIEKCEKFCTESIDCAAFQTSQDRSEYYTGQFWKERWNRKTKKVEKVIIPDHAECKFFKYPKIGSEYRFDDSALINMPEQVALGISAGGGPAESLIRWGHKVTYDSAAKVKAAADYHLYVKKGKQVEDGIRHAEKHPIRSPYKNVKNCKNPIHILNTRTVVPSAKLYLGYTEYNYIHKQNSVKRISKPNRPKGCYMRKQGKNDQFYFNSVPQDTPPVPCSKKRICVCKDANTNKQYIITTSTCPVDLTLGECEERNMKKPYIDHNKPVKDLVNICNKK